MADKLARRFIVIGRVQGVGFRWYVEREARQIGVGGWVRNNPDGNVEVLAAGTAEQLVQLKSKLTQGPRAARVEQVIEEDAADEAAGVQDESFQINGAW